MAGVGKKAADEGWLILWVDEAAFYLLPGLTRTWAPAGQTPILPWTLSRDHLAAISGITATGKLFMQVQEHTFKTVDVVRFLKHVRRHTAAKLIVIWDGAPIHRGHALKDFLHDGASAWLHLEQLPAYAPELQPDEGIWQHLKNVQLRNTSCHTLAALKTELRRAKERLRHKTCVIQGCIRQPGYKV